MALSATSLVAAIPAGIMAALALKGLLSAAGEMPMLILAVAGGATAFGFLIALMPIAILLGKGKSKPKAAKASKAKAKAEEADATGTTDAQTAEVVEDDLIDEADDDTEAFSDELSGSTGEFQFEDDAFLDDEENQ